MSSAPIPIPNPNPLVNLPEFLLLCMEEENITAFKNALNTHWPSLSVSPANSPQKIKITPLHERLDSNLLTETFDLIVSPANFYGRLDTQDVLYERWRGYAPPGSCTLVPFPAEIARTAPWGCRWVALCPNMRMPETVNWDREVVYKCMWSLLCEVEKWNKDVREGVERGGRVQGEGDREGDGGERKRIDRVLMPPLEVGVGNVSKEKWSGQVVLALKHFVDALERHERWMRLEWSTIGRESFEVKKMWHEEQKALVD
ncbi:uncharacterized protein PADG_00431 [Paracoccidioides brasiliensis Pb18]|uniref:Uncharacterized protein n=1 Tax=Paracoccidioides brasiliensis (strain Pb18) TaxID=502780 RepID=C1G0P1_PARBD|nr:uncharacterized protein PADG_00431 [Paracoccidioides brasiliensis Pb18]EEH44142.1 hypothetical protein PADG_00431 [Paracoccidioides brasiliensis Pb18]